MKIAISIVWGTDLAGILHLEKKLSKLNIQDYHVYLRGTSQFEELPQYTFTGTDNPFFDTGDHLDENFYLTTTKCEQLFHQPTIYSWWRNDSFIRKDMPTEHYDCVIAINSPYCFDLKNIEIPDYGTILCNDDIDHYPLSANLFCWVARPSDYSRLSNGWKFFRFVNAAHINMELHRKNMDVCDNHNSYMWKYWLDVQNIKIKSYES